MRRPNPAICSERHRSLSRHWRNTPTSSRPIPPPPPPGAAAKAAEDFSVAIKLEPDDAWHWHQRARVHAQMRRANEALADLRQAIAKGFKGAERIKSDGMLEPLRASDDFKRLLTELEEEHHG